MTVFLSPFIIFILTTAWSAGRTEAEAAFCEGELARRCACIPKNKYGMRIDCKSGKLGMLLNATRAQTLKVNEFSLLVGELKYSYIEDGVDFDGMVNLERFTLHWKQGFIIHKPKL